MNRRPRGRSRLDTEAGIQDFLMDLLMRDGEATPDQERELTEFLGRYFPDDIRPGESAVDAATRILSPSGDSGQKPVPTVRSRHSGSTRQEPSAIQDELDTLEWARSNGNREAELRALNSLINLYYAVQDFDTAEMYSKEQVLKAQEYRKPTDEMYGQEGLARLADEGRHDYFQALRHAKKAREIAIRINDEWGMGKYKDMVNMYEEKIGLPLSS